jgi:hypothetical protein
MITVKIETHEAKVDPAHNIYCIKIENETGVWRDTFGTADTRDTFLRGVWAIAQIAGLEIQMPAGAVTTEDHYFYKR